MAVDIGPKIGIDGEAEYRKKINEIISQAKTLSSEMKKLESSFDSEGKSIKENTEKKKLLNEQIKVQENRVKELSNMLEQSKQKYGENSIQTDKWKQAVNNAETELNNLQKTLKEMPSSLTLVGQKMQDIGSKVTSVGQGMKSVGNTLTSKVTMPIVGAFAASTKAAVDWETAFTGVMKTVDASDAEYAQLAENIKQMATETASSKEDIAGVMEVAGQLGVSGVDNLTAFTKTMIELGDTTNLSAEEAAQALARFTNITGEPESNIEALGSAIVDLGNNFATDEAAIVSMSTRLASAGTIAGLSSTEILALATAMSSVGIEAEAGGTAMTQTLTNISQAVEDGGDKLDVLAKTAGTTADDFAKKWKANPVEALQEFIGGLSKLNEEGESSYAVLDELGMTGIRQSNMLQSLALASDQLTAAVQTSDSAFEQNTALQDEAAKRYETTAAKMSQAKEDIGNLAIEVGERFLPYLEKGIEVIHGMVDAWDSLSTSQQDNIIKIGLVVAAIGPLLSGMGSLIIGTGNLITAGGNIAAFAGKIGPALAPIGTAISGMASSAVAAIPGIVSFMAPFLPFVAIGAAVVAAGVLIYKNWDKIKETAEKVGAVVGEKWNSLKSKTSEAFNDMKTKVSESFNNMKAKATEIAGNISSTVSEKWSNIKSKTAETFNNVKAKTVEVLRGMLTDTKNNLTNMKAAFDSNGGGIKGTVAALWTGVKGYFTTGFNALNTLTNGKLGEIANLFGSLKDKALTWGKDMIGNFIQGIKDKLAEWKETLNGLAQDAANVLKHSHPKQGPMADDNTWMPDMMKLYAKGIKDNAYLINQAIDDVATDISVGMNGYSERSSDNSSVASAIMNAIDPAAIYAAVRDGASDAEITIDIDGRALRRNLGAMGVQFA